jgi:hypothetical protein
MKNKDQKRERRLYRFLPETLDAIDILQHHLTTSQKRTKDATKQEAVEYAILRMCDLVETQQGYQ